MFHLRVRDGVSNRISGLGDFEDEEVAAAEARGFLDNSAPSAGTEAFVEDDSGEIVYTASISDKGNVSGSWKDERVEKAAQRRREAEDKAK